MESPMRSLPIDRAPFPATIASLAGKIVDLDSHEMMPAQIWIEQFGEVARPYAAAIMAKPLQRNPNDPNVPNYAGDVHEFNTETVWRIKGPIAPGAVDMR